MASLTIYDVDFDAQNAYEVADKIRSITYGKYKEDKENVSFHRLYYMLADLCNMLALELYVHPLFENKGIYLLESWKETIKESVENNNTSVLFDALVLSDKKLRNELMKAHMLINDINEHLKSKTDGLENK